MQIPQSQWNRILLGAKDIVKTEAPYKPGRPLKHPTRSTGNLKFNALKLEQISATEWRLFIDERVAHYMPYTNEPWISPKWRGAKNPNEKWFDDATKLVYTFLEREITKEASKQMAKKFRNVAGDNEKW